MKLSKPAIKAHEQALKLLEQDTLTYDEKLFVYANWTPMYSHQVNKAGVFFTPQDMANTFANIEVFGTRVIDLCAGIGMLSFTYYHNSYEKPSITCVEINPDFVSVGKKLLPEATWICASAIDVELLKTLGRFDCAISNPPFGKIGKQKGALAYKGSEFEYMVIEAAKLIADHGAYIIPQPSAPFKYSGQDSFSEQSTDKHEKFLEETGIVLSANCGIDCNTWKDDWNGASPVVEIVRVDYSEIPQPKEIKRERTEIRVAELIDAPNEEYHGEAVLQQVKPVGKGISWADLFGQTGSVFTAEERKERWEQWKNIAAQDKQGREMIEYWSDCKEACEGCRYLQNEWCEHSALPAKFNPVLATIGMACLGVGYDPIDKPQLSLF